MGWPEQRYTGEEPGSGHATAGGSRGEDSGPERGCGRVWGRQPQHARNPRHAAAGLRHSRTPTKFLCLDCEKHVPRWDGLEKRLASETLQNCCRKWRAFSSRRWATVSWWYFALRRQRRISRWSLDSIRDAKHKALSWEPITGVAAERRILCQGSHRDSAETPLPAGRRTARGALEYFQARRARHRPVVVLAPVGQDQFLV